MPKVISQRGIRFTVQTVETTDAHILIHLRSTEMIPGSHQSAVSPAIAREWLTLSDEHGASMPNVPEQYGCRTVSRDRRRGLLLGPRHRPRLATDPGFRQRAVDLPDLSSLRVPLPDRYTAPGEGSLGSWRLVEINRQDATSALTHLLGSMSRIGFSGSAGRRGSRGCHQDRGKGWTCCPTAWWSVRARCPRARLAVE